MSGTPLDIMEAMGTFLPCRGGYWRKLEHATKLMELSERVPYAQVQFRATLACLRDRSRTDSL